MFRRLKNHEFNTVFAYGYCTHMYSAMAAAEQVRNSGGGGSASFGGGGGFSGGGFWRRHKIIIVEKKHVLFLDKSIYTNYN